MKKYKVAENVPEKVNKELSYFSDLEKKMLFKLGIKSKNDADIFFNPEYEDGLHDPFLMKDMDVSVSRIIEAINRNQKIVIYTDYDCDGISSGVILKDFFKMIGFSNFENYIPHRHSEGYGLNSIAVEEIAKKETDLLITADCGSSDYDAVHLGGKLGMDILITDHHIVPEKTPPSFSLLNPKRNDDEYPDKNISGAVVVYKLIQGIIEKGNFNLTEGKEKWLLDLVGISVIADMVPLIGENRVFAHYGLLVLKKTKRVGILEMLKSMKVNQKFISEDDVSFMIAPRINACSRMDNPKKAFDLLSTDDLSEAKTLADEIQKINDKRKGVVASMIKEIRAKIESKKEFPEVIVTGNPKWKPALLGLAANTLVKEYKKPVFLWGREGNGLLKGSCRSDGSINLCTLMDNTKEVLSGFGGHKWAGGFSIPFESVHSLEEEIVNSYKKMETKTGEEDFLVDYVLNADDVNQKTIFMLEKFSPFGEGNPKPIFLFENIKIFNIKKFGKEKSHLSISFKNKNGFVRGLKFFYEDGDFEKEPKEGGIVNMVGSIEKSFFAGTFEIRLRILDIT